MTSLLFDHEKGYAMNELSVGWSKIGMKRIKPSE